MTFSPQLAPRSLPHAARRSVIPSSNGERTARKMALFLKQNWSTGFRWLKCCRIIVHSSFDHRAIASVSQSEGVTSNPDLFVKCDEYFFVSLAYSLVSDFLFFLDLQGIVSIFPVARIHRVTAVVGRYICDVSE